MSTIEGHPHAFEGERNAFGPLNNTSPALEAFRVVKTGDGILYGFTVTNTGAAQFVLGFDQRTLPADGAVPLFAFPIAADDALPLNWIPGRTFLSGLVLANSSTNATLTIGAADCIFDAQYL